VSKDASLPESGSKAIEPVASQETGTEAITLFNSNLAENIDALSNDVSDVSGSIDRLTATLPTLLESASSSTFTQAAIVAFVGAFSAYLFNLFHWRMVEKKLKVSRIGLALDMLVKELESTAVDYWTQDFKEENHQQIHTAEIAIKSKIRLISRYIRLITPKLNTNKTTSTKQKLEDFGLEIFDLVTGDEFESKARKSSKPKAMKIAIRCSDIRALISALDCSI
jgi:hypothetical protein